MKKIRHIGIIILWAAVLYVPFALMWQVLGIETITIFLKGAVVWAVFNQPLVITGQMWFLFAVYIFMAQGMHLLGYSVPNYLYRNWLVEGLPFFLLGYYIHEKENRGNVEKLANNALIIVLTASTLLCFVERYIMGRDFGVNIVTIPQVTSMFCLTVNNPDFGEGVIQTIGKKYSMFVYVLHPFVWKILSEIYKLTGVDDNVAALYLLPILVCAFTLLLSATVFMIKNRSGIRNENINNPNQ